MSRLVSSIFRSKSCLSFKVQSQLYLPMPSVASQLCTASGHCRSRSCTWLAQSFAKPKQCQQVSDSKCYESWTCWILSKPEMCNKCWGKKNSRLVLTCFRHPWHLLKALPIKDVALISSRRCWLRWAVAMASVSSGSAAPGVASAKLRASAFCMANSRADKSYASRKTSATMVLDQWGPLHYWDLQTLLLLAFPLLPPPSGIKQQNMQRQNMLTGPHGCCMTCQMQSPFAVWPPILLQHGLFLCLGETWETTAKSGQLEVQYHQRSRFNSRDVDDGSQLQPF